LAFLLAHLSDAHIGPLPPARKRDLMGKRLTGYLNWKRGRSTAHDMDILGGLVTDMQAQEPDHIAMTGDIMNIGLPGEFVLADAWLRTLGEPGSTVSFVAGNHDAYTRKSLPTLARTFAPWTASDATGLPGYPYLKERNGVALIGLCSGVPTAPFIASGRLGSKQRHAFEAMLMESGARGLTRVVMIHHPPHMRGTSVGRGLTDERAFADIMARVGAELVIHGHNHKPSVIHLPTPNRPVPIVGVASASALKGTTGRRAGYHLFSIEGTGPDARIEGRVRGLPAGSQVFCDLEPLSLEPSRSVFQKLTAR
jgi:3',5'-cyclic AMP phosphodiesterase CpdA